MTSSTNVITDPVGERNVIMTGITNITARVVSGMLVLTGKCSRCSGDVARVIEND
jgi:hypothetical protein